MSDALKGIDLNQTLRLINMVLFRRIHMKKYASNDPEVTEEYEVRAERCSYVFKEVSSQEHFTYLPRTDTEMKIPNPRYYVRLPALLRVLVKTDANFSERYFDTPGGYRWQSGTHLFIQSTQPPKQLKGEKGNPHNVEMVDTGWLKRDGKWKYQVLWTRSPIHEVYPLCVRKDSPLMVLGVLFSTSPPTNRFLTRTQSRCQNARQNPYSEDMSVDYVDFREKKSPAEAIIHHFSGVGANEPAVAFFVCEGARLVVQDDLAYRRKDYSPRVEKVEIIKASKKSKKGTTTPHNRALYQQGSLVVLKNVTLRLVSNVFMDGQIDLNKIYTQDWKMTNNQNDQSLLPEIYSQELNEEERKETGLTQNSHPCDLTRKVIFLGATESQKESITWYLRLESNADNDLKTLKEIQYTRCDLVCPERGHIEDVTSWEWGFFLIRWRLIYQRPQESVFYHEDRPPSKPSMDFKVPKIENIHLRILGVEGHRHPARVRQPAHLDYPAPKCEIEVNKDGTLAKSITLQDMDVRRAIEVFEGGLQYHWKALPTTPIVNRVPQRPLLPPLYKNEKWHYWTHWSKVFVFAYTRERKPLVWSPQYPNDHYQLEYGAIPEYQWNVIYEQGEEASYTDKRMATDFRFWTKQSDQSIGEVNAWWLKSIPEIPPGAKHTR